MQLVSSTNNPSYYLMTFSANHFASVLVTLGEITSAYAEGLSELIPWDAGSGRIALRRLALIRIIF